MKLFDAHCHLQDPRILNMVPNIIRSAVDRGVVHFAVNGVSENDWQTVKEISKNYPSVVPNFGLHPWFISDRSPNWLKTLKEYFEATPEAAVGEIGLDKGSVGKKIDFRDQVEVFRQQLCVAKELKRPVSTHCVCAYGDLLEILKSEGPFPNGIILHSFLGPAEMVPEFAKLGAYFSFSGFLMSLKESKAKKMVRSVPLERILLETDAPDGFPTLCNSLEDALVLTEEGSEERLNHPANIKAVLDYVASLLEMSIEKLADVSFSNALNLFSFDGSKLGRCCSEVVSGSKRDEA
ncbi:unnamed protein product [Cuscuta campestris]|uniref:TatD related DNase n=1 Tax=Cuscuta campestris TaxID=132261 RepID=A0A484MJP7_9ASTE|nr:unnamed protein product [Cuscuta campestris]